MNPTSSLKTIKGVIPRPGSNPNLHWKLIMSYTKAFKIILIKGCTGSKQLAICLPVMNRNAELKHIIQWHELSFRNQLLTSRVYVTSCLYTPSCLYTGMLHKSLPHRKYIHKYSKYRHFITGTKTLRKIVSNYNAKQLNWRKVTL